MSEMLRKRGKEGRKREGKTSEKVLHVESGNHSNVGLEWSLRSHQVQPPVLGEITYSPATLFPSPQNKARSQTSLLTI